MSPDGHRDLTSEPAARRFSRFAEELTATEPSALDAVVRRQATELTGAARVDVWHRSGGRFERKVVDTEVASATESEIPSLYGAQSVAVFPLQMSERRVGYLALAFEGQRLLDAEQSALLRGYAAMVSLSLCRATESDLNAALQVRDELLSIASHELNTPLTALQLNLQSLLRKVGKQPNGKVDSAQVQASLTPMVSQLGRLSHMLTHLLDVARIQTGRMFLDLEAFDLSEAMREVVARFGALAAARGCTLVLQPSEPLIGYWDRLRVEQVLQNLLSNAVKYGEGKPVTVWVRKRDGDRVEVAVKDEGIGIPEADLARIFDRFERATLKRQSDSFGLGLYISSQIARAHGGSIEVESTPGRGSIFRLSLPTHRVFDTPEGQTP
jgi:signal transduction histidine kinase